jgi:hypothetical protein
LFHGIPERQAQRAATLPQSGHADGESCYEPRDITMMARTKRQRSGWLLAAALLAVATPSLARGGANSVAVETYVRARTAYETEASAYWKEIADKRRARFAKRRSKEPVGIDDYVLGQPPLYTGPPRPAELPLEKEPGPPPERIPVVADFLKAAAEQYGFVPDRPTEAQFKQAYAKVAAATGLTREQAVRVYAFETGGNGTYDGQAGLSSAGGRKNGRPISPAIGYNQLLTTNSVGLLAEHGDRFVVALMASAAKLDGAPRQAMDRKIAALRKMVAFSRSVPNAWSEHDKLAKTTPGGMGIHAAVLDRDIGPLLQTQKLLDSVVFARAKGYGQPLTGGELELMNFTGDGNGFDMVLMPQELREKVPTSNFFQRGGYERNPIARRTGTVAALIASIETKMDQLSQAPGAKELGEAF